MKKDSFIWVLIGVFVVALDWITKYLVVTFLHEGEIIPLIDGFFNLTLSYNRGAAFGFLADIENPRLRQGLLWSATALALIAVTYLFFKEYREDVRGRFGLALVFGGAVGNMIDRFNTGRVVDFLDFYYGEWHWPAFNVADSSICIGVVILLFFARSKLDSSKNISEGPSKDIKPVDSSAPPPAKDASNSGDSAQTTNEAKEGGELKAAAL